MFLFQRLSIALQRGNVIAFLSTFDTNKPWSLFCLTSNFHACHFVLVGLNKIMIIITTMICMVLSSWLRAIARVYVVHLINAD